MDYDSLPLHLGGNPSPLSTYREKILDKDLGDQDFPYGNNKCCPYLPPQQLFFNHINNLIYLSTLSVRAQWDNIEQFKTQA
jgi:hypothetical protein